MTDKPVTAPVKPFLDRLADGTLVFDGAMGTMIYARGVYLNRCFDELNLSSATLVRSIHEEYVAAGAEVIETNTFGAHRFKLGPHGLEAQVRRINREGARIAREAAQGRALVAGAIGPIGKPLAPLGNVRAEDAQAAYREQVEGLLEGGVDIFILETMPSLDQAKVALAAVRSVTTDAPAAVSLTFNEEGNTIYGDQVEDVVRELEALGVPMIGANCSQGPQAMLDTVQRMAAVARSARLSAIRRTKRLLQDRP
jgi:methionine synthase I (cobalamin-dependent)